MILGWLLLITGVLLLAVSVCRWLDERRTERAQQRRALERALVVQLANQRLRAVSRAALVAMLDETQRRRP
jgi:hypothetical protein